MTEAAAAGTEKKRVCLGAIAGAHGVRGEMRVKTFTEAPENIAAYGPLESEDGQRRFTLKVVRVQAGDIVIARAPEVGSREEAQSLKGVRLYAPRSALPEPEEDEFYLDDLVGLRAVDEDDAPLGHVSAVYNFGAGDLIELKGMTGKKGVHLIAFTRAAVPAVDLAAGTITVDPGALGEDGANGADPLSHADYIAAAMREEDS